MFRLHQRLCDLDTAYKNFFVLALDFDRGVVG